MFLQDLADVAPIEVVRDGEFHHLGSLSDLDAQMLVRIQEEKFIHQLKNTPNASCVLTSETLAPLIPYGLGVIIAEDPQNEFFRIHNYLAKETHFYGEIAANDISSDAVIHPTATIAERGVKIGPRTVIEAGVVVHENTIIGSDTLIRSNSVIATEGFYFKRIGETILPVAHAGGVLIGDRVEVQAGCCISKAIFGGYTKIGDDTKLDNLVHIAHNAVIGQRCLIAAHAMLAGYVNLGDDSWVGPSACISNDVKVGSHAQVSIGSVVVQDVEDKQHVTGNFAVNHSQFLRFFRTLKGKR